MDVPPLTAETTDTALRPVAGALVSFTVDGAAAGARATLPLTVSTAAYGLVFGVLARQVGMAPLEVALMSGAVFSGAAQFVALGFWATPLPVLSIVLATLVVNLRHLLLGIALRPWAAGLRAGPRAVAAFFLVDESWALAMRELRRGGRDAGFLIGSGLVMYAAWFGASVVGRFAGASVDDPARWGLDFAFTAVFIALLAGFWRGRADLLPWSVAAVVAVIGHAVLPGSWHILLGGLAGSLVGAVRNGR